MNVEEDRTPSHSPKETTPVRIQKDMKFLNASWANLAEQKDDIEESGDHVSGERRQSD